MLGLRQNAPKHFKMTEKRMETLLLVLLLLFTKLAIYLLFQLYSYPVVLLLLNDSRESKSYYLIRRRIIWNQPENSTLFQDLHKPCRILLILPV